MNDIRIFFVSPYEGMREAINGIVRDAGNIEYEIFVGNLSNLDETVEKIKDYKPDIVISRGLTAEEISKRIDQPVVKIKLQAYDILSAIRQAQGYNRPFAVVGYDDMTSGAEVICGLLNYNTQIVTVKNESDFKDAITGLKRKGYDLIVGGTLASGLADKIGLTGITIISGDKSIEDAIKEGINIFNAYKCKTFETELLLKLNDLNPTKAYLFDSEFKLIYGDSVNASLCTYLEEQCRKMTGGHSINTVIDSDGIRYIIEGKTINSGKEYFAFYIDKKSTADGMNDTAVRILSNENINYSLPDLTYESSRYMGSVVAAAKTALTSCKSVIIEGDAGTEKDDLAAFVFKRSIYSDRFLISLDMPEVSDRDIKLLFNDYRKLFAGAGCIVYMKNAEAAAKSVSSELINYIDKYNLTCILSLNSKRLTGSSPIIDYIRNERDYRVLKIPPLAERKEDINNFARMYIAESNLKTAKSNIGLDENAAKYLETYSWPENLKQLRRVIAKAVTLSEKYYLSAEDLKSAIDEDEMFICDVSKKIDLSGSLKEITKEVIETVLDEENGSRIRTAERLQISRSKLWSILKDNAEADKPVK